MFKCVYIYIYIYIHTSTYVCVYIFSRISHMTVSPRLAEAGKLQAASPRPPQGHTQCS